MRKILLTGLFLASSLACFAQHTRESLVVGSTVPLSSKPYVTANKGRISLEKIRTDKGLLVMFSCNTCPYVIKSQQRTKEMMAYASQKGIGMVIINSNEANRRDADAPAAMKAYAKAQSYDVPYLIDEQSELADAFGATRTPEVYLFNGSGKLVYKGAMEDNPSDPASSKEIFLRTAINNMLAGKPIDPNSTKSIGCSIKRSM